MTREVRRFDGDGRVEEADVGDYEVIPDRRRAVRAAGSRSTAVR